MPLVLQDLLEAVQSVLQDGSYEPIVEETPMPQVAKAIVVVTMPQMWEEVVEEIQLVPQYSHQRIVEQIMIFHVPQAVEGVEMDQISKEVVEEVAQIVDVLVPHVVQEIVVVFIDSFDSSPSLKDRLMRIILQIPVCP